jgi:flagellar hook-associated protein 3 FlgL
MRVSTSQIFQQGIEAFQQQQQKLATLQQQISTGVRLNKPSDDPAAATRILVLEQNMAKDNQFQANIEVARNRLTFEETRLDGVENIIFRLKELAVQGNNGSLDPTALNAIGAEVNERLQELLSLANSKDENGDYLFAGYQNGIQPFAATLTGSINHVTYSGDQGQRALQISESRQINVDNSGSEVFLQLASATALNEFTSVANTGTATMAPAHVFDASVYIPGNYEIRFTAPGVYDVFDVDNAVNIVTGATYSDSTDIDFQGVRTSITGAPASGDVFTISAGQNKDIFESVQTLSETLNGSLNSAQRASNFDEFLTDLDVFFDRVLNVRTSIGGRMNALDSQQDANEANIVATQKALSVLRDTDLAEAISQLTLEQTTLEAAQAVFTRITRSSLLDFLR